MGKAYFAWEPKERGVHKRNEALDCKNYATAAITKEIAKKHLEAWLKAEMAVTCAQLSYTQSAAEA